MRMTPHRLAAKIRKLREQAPITTRFERILAGRGTWNSGRAWYTSQKEHWLGWLAEYHGPGYYGRKNSDRSAEVIYNHIACPPMALWLAEASGIPEDESCSGQAGCPVCPSTFSCSMCRYKKSHSLGND